MSAQTNIVAQSQMGQKKIAIIAGGGALPEICLKRIRENGDLPYLIAIDGEVSNLESLSTLANETYSTRIGKLSAPINKLKKWGVTEVVMVGGIRREGLFLRIRPDFRVIKILKALFDRRDDSLLRVVTAELEKDGITVIGAHELLPELTPKVGVLANRALTSIEKADAQLGWNVLETLGACDVGQSVVAFEGTIIAIEGIEGTDAMIKRAGELCSNRGGVLVKKAKSSQDLRLDRPTIGVKTIEAMKASGLTALVIDAKGSLFLDPQAIISTAAKYHISIEGWDR